MANFRKVLQKKILKRFHVDAASRARVEAGFEYVTGDYADGGKIFRKRK